jgi:hypothetical protein
MTRADVARQLAYLTSLDAFGANGRLMKIAAAAGDEDIEYCEAWRDPEADPAHWGGRIVMFTPTRVIDAHVQAGPGDDLVAVGTWGRTLLVDLTISGPDSAWEDLEEGFAPGSEVSLTYPDREGLRLPLNPGLDKSAKQLGDLLPGLLVDLARG